MPGLRSSTNENTENNNDNPYKKYSFKRDTDIPPWE